MICKVCGISSNQARVVECRYLGYELCPGCCEGVGGGFLEECKDCTYTKALQKHEDIPLP
jgi:hypothetical protein